mmetsp:Transcript_11793/g.36443  ORF Transcript_11793/g.36443 Transcript_11793/m.36443 type:complete len:216 (-) Transcript_11793:1902-2549(-)
MPAERPTRLHWTTFMTALHNSAHGPRSCKRLRPYSAMISHLMMIAWTVWRCRTPQRPHLRRQVARSLVPERALHFQMWRSLCDLGMRPCLQRICHRVSSGSQSALVPRIPMVAPQLWLLDFITECSHTSSHLKAEGPFLKRLAVLPRMPWRRLLPERALESGVPSMVPMRPSPGDCGEVVSSLQAARLGLWLHALQSLRRSWSATRRRSRRSSSG